MDILVQPFSFHRILRLRLLISSYSQGFPRQTQSKRVLCPFVAQCQCARPQIVHGSLLTIC